MTNAMPGIEPGLWNKTTAIYRELKRAEDELKSVLAEKELAVYEKEGLANQLESLQAKSTSDDRTIKQLSRAADEAKILSSKLELLTESNKRAQKEISTLRTNFTELNASKQQEIAILQTNYINTKDEFDSLTIELNELKEQIANNPRGLIDQSGGDILNSNDSDLDSLTDVQSLKNAVQDLQNRLQQSEAKRRRMHNTLQELRGNIRVYVRCRPFLKCDGESYETKEGCMECGGKDSASVSIVGQCKGAGQSFVFDQIFRQDASQDDIYKEVSGLVQSAVDGYKVCIFSYGQTGSGKVFAYVDIRMFI